MIDISKKQIESDIQSGLKREDIIKKYSTETVKLTNGDVTKILEATGLKIRKFHKPKFKIIEDEPTNIAKLPLDPTVAKEIKEIAEKGVPVDLSREYNLAK